MENHFVKAECIQKWQDKMEMDDNPDIKTGERVARPPHEYGLTPMQDLALIAQGIQTIFEKYHSKLKQLHPEGDEAATYAINDVYPGGNVFLRLDNLAAHIGEWMEFVYTMHEMWRQSTRRGWPGLVPGFSGPDALEQLLAELVNLRRGLKCAGLAVQGPLMTLNKLSSWRGGYTIIGGIESRARMDQLAYLRVLITVIDGTRAGVPEGQKEIRGLTSTHDVMAQMEKRVEEMIKVVRQDINAVEDLREQFGL